MRPSFLGFGAKRLSSGFSRQHLAPRFASKAREIVEKRQTCDRGEEKLCSTNTEDERLAVAVAVAEAKLLLRMSFSCKRAGAGAHVSERAVWRERHSFGRRSGKGFKAEGWARSGSPGWRCTARAFWWPERSRSWTVVAAFRASGRASCKCTIIWEPRGLRLGSDLASAKFFSRPCAQPRPRTGLSPKSADTRPRVSHGTVKYKPAR